MQQRFFIFLLSLTLFSCGRKEKILKNTSIAIEFSTDIIDLTKPYQSIYLSVFKNREELLGSFRSMLNYEFEEKSLAVLDSNANYTLHIDAVTLKELKKDHTVTDCDGDDSTYSLKEVKLEITLTLFDQSGKKINSWSKLTSKKENVTSSTEEKNENGIKECNAPQHYGLGIFDEYKELNKQASYFCRKITNGIVKAE